MPKSSYHRILLATCMIALLSSCTDSRGVHGLMGNRLAPCPETPNCVSSDADDEKHKVAPYRLVVEPAEAWNALKEVIASQERTTIVTVNESYLHAEARSAVFRFVDDIEFHLRGADEVIAVRSASRVGRSDFGVNRDRVEGIRSKLRARRVVE